MSKISIILAAAAAAAALAATAVSAQVATLPGSVMLFISPCGEPFEAPKGDPYPIVKWFDQADANHDGKLDIDEMRNDAARFFKVLDRNHDGVIDNYEIDFYEYRLVPEILSPNAALDGGIVRVSMQPGVEPIDPGGGAPGQEGVERQRLDGNQGAVFYSLFHEPEPVRSADRNFDFKITLAEFLAHSDRQFKTLDTDNKGYFTLAELPKTDAEKAAKAHR